jgi:hypothetical protein
MPRICCMTDQRGKRLVRCKKRGTRKRFSMMYGIIWVCKRHDEIREKIRTGK